MPRVNSLDPTRRKIERITSYIRIGMKLRKITQVEMAEALDITQSNFSKLLSRGHFSMEQLLKIFTKLGSTAHEIGDLMV